MNETGSFQFYLPRGAEFIDSEKFIEFREKLVRARECGFDPQKIEPSRLASVQKMIHYSREHCRYYNSAFYERSSVNDGFIEEQPVLERQHLANNIMDIIPDEYSTDCLDWQNTAGTLSAPLKLPTMGFNLERRSLLILSALDDGLSQLKRNILHITTLENGICFRAEPETLNGGAYISLKLPLGNREHLFEICRTALKDPPDILIGSPEAVIYFANTLKEMKIKLPSFGHIISTEYSLFPAARKRIKELYGTVPLEMYSTVETGPIAMECSRHEGMHLLHPDLFLEVVDRLDRPMGFSDTGQLLMTTSANPVLPLIRYRIGDLAILSSVPCPCGNRAPRLLDVQPRGEKLFSAFGTGINIAEVHEVISTLPLIRYRIIHKDEGVSFEYFSFEPPEKVEPMIHSVIDKMFSPLTGRVIKREESLAKNSKYLFITSEHKEGPVGVGLRRTRNTADQLEAALLDCMADLDIFARFKKDNQNILVLAGGDCPPDSPDLLSMLRAMKNVAVENGCRLFFGLPPGCTGYPGSVGPEEEFFQGNKDSLPAAVSLPELSRNGKSEFTPTVKSPILDMIDEFDFVINLAVQKPGGQQVYNSSCRNFSESLLAREEAGKVADEFYIDLLCQLNPDLNISIIDFAGNKGNNEDVLLVMSESAVALDCIGAEIHGVRGEYVSLLRKASQSGLKGASLADINIFGIQPEIGRRPCPAASRTSKTAGDEVIAVRGDSCNRCGKCYSVCPAGCISIDKKTIYIDHSLCIRCYNCVEFCEEDVLVPLSGEGCSVSGRMLIDRGPWLSHMSGAPPVPGCHPYPPSYLIPEPSFPSKVNSDVYILGLAINTLQEHAAALVKNGEIVGAAEEERFRRIKHYGWTPPSSPGTSLSSDPLIPIEQAFCWDSIQSLLDMEGISITDVDFIAVNGIPARYRRTFCNLDSSIPPDIVKSGRLIFVPHHKAHAASAFRVSGFDSAPVFTVDGSGDRETAAFFKGRSGDLEFLFDVLSIADCSIGGVYETATRILGFGDHGQGSTMALAAMGRDRFDLSDYLSIDDHRNTRIHEWAIAEAFRNLQRDRQGLLVREHRDFAASVQNALEQVCISLLKEGLEGRETDRLCMAGGVALNCSMNRRIRTELGIGDIMIQPAAHDAGTALGAALEACHLVTGKSPGGRMKSAYLGPEFDNEKIRETLEKFGVPFQRPVDMERECAELISQGNILCRFSGRMEFGPRALGNRSILAHPGDPAAKEKLNRMKSREPWRPFGPSVLHDKQEQYFEDSFYSPFMLFTFAVTEPWRDKLKAIVHRDGTTRPQSVDRNVNNRYYTLISHFEEITGLPMVLNTSFNTGDEPIVCTPEDAIRSFARLGADYLAIGDYLVHRESLLEKGCSLREVAAQVASRAAPVPRGGQSRKRLHLRLGVTCNNNCRHCTIGDMKGMEERTTGEAICELLEGREEGCEEVVFMRGGALMREDAVYLTGRARDMGYRLIQFQTNGRILSYKDFVRRLVGAGATHFEVSIFGDSAGLHDAIAGQTGAFAQTVKGLKNLLDSGIAPMVTVPVIKSNYKNLSRIVMLLKKLGVERVQLNYSRPVRVDGEVVEETIVKLSKASPFITEALRRAVSLEMAATTEAVPCCHLATEFREMGEIQEDWGRHMVSDLHIKHDSGTSQRKEMRPRGPECEGCVYENTCPTTWVLYQELFGTSEFTKIEE